MTRSSRSTAQKRDRKPLTKEMLLPLPVGRVRTLSLENHLALATMRSGHGSVDVMTSLIRIVYLAYFMRDAQQDRGDLDVFRAAEAVLERSATRAEERPGWTVPEEDLTVLEQVVALHDQQLASAPAHHYAKAWARLQHFMSSDVLSPIASP